MDGFCRSPKNTRFIVDFWKNTLPLISFVVIFIFVIFNNGCGGRFLQHNDDNQVFPIPHTIVIPNGPFNSVDDALSNQDLIDWYRDTEKAKAITLAYAAKEIYTHCAKAGLSTKITSGRYGGGSSIYLITQQDITDDLELPRTLFPDFQQLGEQGFVIIPHKGNIFILAQGRVGVLYGTYRLLEEIGFFWHDVYETNIPSDLEGRRFWKTILEIPTIAYRGHWIYSPVPDEYAVWMARNRLNLAGGVRGPLAHNLGIKVWDGAEWLLQQELSKPGLFEAHPDWFALVDGVRMPITSSGTFFNPCFANPEMATYFAERMIERLNSGDLADVDVLNVWPSDARFKTNWDQSLESQLIGNESDNLLFFYSMVAKKVEDAFKEGRISRLVAIAGESYYVTWEPPTNDNVIATLNGLSNYIHIFYPNERDWSDVFNHNLLNRTTNSRLTDCMQKWTSKIKSTTGVVDYNNYSQYSAVALSDAQYYGANFQMYKEFGVNLIGYMHPLLHNPGPLRMTNVLMSKLPWLTMDVDKNSYQSISTSILQDYFTKRYGSSGKQWMDFQLEFAKTAQNAKELFGDNSLSWVLFRNFIWSGSIYPASDSNDLISRYLAGGVQDLPAKFSGRTWDRETFLGLDDSIRMQADLKTKSVSILNNIQTEETRSHIDSDLLWIDATMSRYRLIRAACEFTTIQYSNGDTSKSREEIQKEIEYLQMIPITKDTLTAINQRGFLDFYRKLIMLPAPMRTKSVLPVNVDSPIDFTYAGTRFNRIDSSLK